MSWRCAIEDGRLDHVLLRALLLQVLRIGSFKVGRWRRTGSCSGCMNPCFPGLRQGCSSSPRPHDGRQQGLNRKYNAIGQPDDPIDKAAPPPDRKISHTPLLYLAYPCLCPTLRFSAKLFTFARFQRPADKLLRQCTAISSDNSSKYGSREMLSSIAPVKKLMVP